MTRDRPARANMAVSEKELEGYLLARAFLTTEVIGSIVMVLSFTALYIGQFVMQLPSRPLIIGSLVVMAIGSYMFLTSRQQYNEARFPLKKKLETTANVFALSGLVFWLLFLLLIVLAFFGVSLLPS